MPYVTNFSHFSRTHLVLSWLILIKLGDAIALPDDSLEAQFTKAIPNLSVVRGKDAHMRCSVINLGVHKVSWIHVDKQNLLTIQEHVITPNPRIKVQQENSTWTLVINKVDLDDRGYYMCQISTQPPKSQVGFLDVVVPPFFEDRTLKGDTNVTVREYENVTLSCRADGNPKPRIMWRREDGRDIKTSSSDESAVVFTDELVLHEVTRWTAGVYICVANSGVAPSISRRIMLVVQFAPMIRIPSQSITAGYGQDVTLECLTESYPLAHQEWLDPYDNKINALGENSYKYKLHAQTTYTFKVIYRLTIIQVDFSDAGRYVCQVRNSLGVTRSALTLQVVDRSIVNTATTTATSVSPSQPPTELPIIASVYSRSTENETIYRRSDMTAYATDRPRQRQQKSQTDYDNGLSVQSIWNRAKQAVTSSSARSMFVPNNRQLGLPVEAAVLAGYTTTMLLFYLLHLKWL